MSSFSQEYEIVCQRRQNCQRFKAKLGGSFCDHDWDNGDDKMMMFANICEMAQFRQRLNAKHGGSRSDKRLNAGTLVKPTKPEDGELIKSA